MRFRVAVLSLEPGEQQPVRFVFSTPARIVAVRAVVLRDLSGAGPARLQVANDRFEVGARMELPASLARGRVASLPVSCLLVEAPSGWVEVSAIKEHPGGELSVALEWELVE